MKNPDWLDFLFFFCNYFFCNKIFFKKKEKLGGVLAFLFQIF